MKENNSARYENSINVFFYSVSNVYQVHIQVYKQPEQIWNRSHATSSESELKYEVFINTDCFGKPRGGGVRIFEQVKNGLRTKFECLQQFDVQVRSSIQ